MRSGTRRQSGFSLIEMLISLVVLLAAMGGLASLLLQNSRINKQQQMTADVQSNARNALSIVVQRLRSAGWDPNAAGFTPVVTDTDTTDTIAEIEVFADLVEPPDGLTNGLDEQVMIRHVNDQIVWRRRAADPFEVLAINISNDANGDGTIEPMFVPDVTPNPTRITVQITARSPVVDPVSGDFIRYTVSSDVVLRSSI
jgi:prepilin-type N-terminal cleavage/methylation domain-containing protein